MHSKHHQIPGFWPEIFRSSQYWSFITQLNLAKSESSKKKKSAYGKTYATTALCTKVLSCIRNTTKFLVVGRKYFAPVNIGHLLNEIFRFSPYRSFIIQLNLAKSESSKTSAYGKIYGTIAIFTTFLSHIRNSTNSSCATVSEFPNSS